MNAYPAVDLEAYPGQATIAYGDSIQLNATGAIQYFWRPSEYLNAPNIDNPWAKPLKPILFAVEGINKYGCKDTAYVNIDIDYTMPDLIPNAFSPNGDGLNDVFKIEGITYQQILAFKVFNRFGQQVFNNTNPDKGWDGTSQGKPCEAGVYYYFIQLAYPDGREQTFKGDVMLIR